MNLPYSKLLANALILTQTYTDAQPMTTEMILNLHLLNALLVLMNVIVNTYMFLLSLSPYDEFHFVFGTNKLKKKSHESVDANTLESSIKILFNLLLWSL